MNARRIHVAISSIAIAVLACTIGQAPPVRENLPATITAQVSTIQAPSATLGAPTLTPAPLLTNTPGVPEVRVSSATNCRTGPGIVYDLLWTMYPADVAVVVGRHTATGYWIVNKPNGGTCWLWGQYATVSGNIAALPEYPTPPTPTPSEPAAPTNFKVTATCTVIPATLTYAVHISMSWVDVATNEQGYHIFRNGTLLATLAANSTSFEHDTTLPVAPAVFPPVPGPSINYAIEAFNGSGESPRKDRDVGCD